MEHKDVIIIGAGISGIGAACHLSQQSPARDYSIFERRADIGGTWSLFKYPGIRSDSDMYTFGYNFRPWEDDKDIASADRILQYLEDTCQDFDLYSKIRFDTAITKAEWISAKNMWIVDFESNGEKGQISCNFLLSCTGYYNYDAGYRPDFPGEENFTGQIVHPQHWPEDLDYADKSVVIIGSGATAVTLMPAMAETAKHVTMLQRSPTYVFSRPSSDKIANTLKKWLPKGLAHSINRFRYALMGWLFFTVSKKWPEKVRAYLFKQTNEKLSDDFDTDTHFQPDYDPWDQRVCLVPDADMFNAINQGTASVVTDHIDTFTKTGIKTTSGKTIDADIIVTATGLQIQFLGGCELVVDGKTINPNDHTMYRGMMMSNIPNMVVMVGYTNASWTLKVDLTGAWICRLLNHMDKQGYKAVMPRLDDNDPMAREPLLGLKSGYLTRALDLTPTQGTRMPWRNQNHYVQDYFAIKFAKLNDSVLVYK